MMCHKDSCNCKSNMTWMVVIVLVVIGAVAYYVYGMNETQNTTPNKNNMMTGSDAMMKKNAMMKDDSAMMAETSMEKKNAMMKKDDAPKMMAPIGSVGYMDYSPELATSAMKSGKTVVLFFAASWCPSCKALDKTIQADLGSIPADTLVLKVDYDTSAELKKQYGVVTQHTTVVLGTDGTLKSKKIGAQSVAEVVGK